MRERRAFIRALNRAVAISKAPAGTLQPTDDRRRLPIDEPHRAEDSMPAHEANVERPAALSMAGEIKRTDQDGRPNSRNFDQHIDATDSLRARGMGVLLD